MKSASEEKTIIGDLKKVLEKVNRELVDGKLLGGNIVNEFECFSDMMNEWDEFIKNINQILLMLNVKNKEKNLNNLLEKEIMKRKLAEEIIRKERDFISRVLDTANILVIVLGVDGRIVRFNKFSEKLTGFNQEEVIGKSIFDLFISNTDKTKIEKMFRDIVDGKDISSVENEWILKDGTRKMISWSNVVLRNEKGETKFIIGTGIDISELVKNRMKLENQAYELERKNVKLKESQVEIQDERDKAQKYLNISGVIIIALDKKGVINLINDTGCEILGLDRDEVLGDNWFNIAFDVRHKENELKWFNKVLAEEVEKDEYHESDIMSSENEIRTILWKSTPLYNETGEVVGVLSSGNDITKQKEIDLMKAELLNTVSHEIRTPLGSILGFSELIIKRNPGKEKILNYITTIHKESIRLMELINDFLDLQRMENGKQVFNMKNFMLDDIIFDIKKLFEDVKSHKIIFDKQANYELFGDYNKLKQVFTNLLSNAIKYSPEEDRIIVYIREIGDVINFCIEDYGFGIEEKHQEHIFKNFYRVEHSKMLKIEGTGLGLSICEKIVKAHGGIIWVDSIVGKGSKFYFSIPKNRT